MSRTTDLADALELQGDLRGPHVTVEKDGIPVIVAALRLAQAREKYLGEGGFTHTNAEAYKEATFAYRAARERYEQEKP